MRPASLALAHLRRSPAKAALLALGLAIGVATVATLLSITWTMERVLGDTLRSSGVTARITPARQEWSFSYAGLSVGSASYQAVDLPADTLDAVDRMAGADVVAPRLLQLVSGPDGGDALAVGVDFAAERQLRPYWQVTGRYPESPSEVVLGDHLAKLWQIGEGGRVRLQGRDYRVTGVLGETGQEEDGLAFLSLPEVQSMAGRPGALTFIEARTSVGLERQEAWRGQLAVSLPGTEVVLVRNVDEARLSLLDKIRAFSPLATLIALVAGALLVAASQFASTRERTREVGVLRAMGYRSRHVMEALLAEVVVLGTAAAALGYAGGLGAAKALLPLLDAATPAAAVAWSPGLGMLLWAGAVGLCIAAAFVPARQIAATDPAEALRFL